MWFWPSARCDPCWLCVQEFRRLSTALGAARDRAELLPAATSDTSALLGMQARCPLVEKKKKKRICHFLKLPLFHVCRGQKCFVSRASQSLPVGLCGHRPAAGLQ